MRVAFLFQGADWNGSARAFAAAAHAFAGAGDSVVFIVDADSHVQERLVREAYTIAPAELHTWWLPRALRIRRLIRASRSEVVFVHTETEHLDAALASRLGGGWAVVRRAPAGVPLSRGWRTRLATRLAPASFLFTSEREARAALVPLELGPSVAASLGVSAASANPTSSEEDEEIVPDPRHILCIYDGVSRGRTALPIRTVALLAPRHSEIRLTIVGPGSDAEEIRMHVAALDIIPRVDLLGEREDIAHLARGATFGWVACTGDDAAFAMLDSMRAGLLVVAQYDEVSRHYVADGITGLLVPPEDATLAAGILAGVMSHAAQVQRMAEAARLRAARVFGEQQMLEGFDQAARAARGSRSHTTG